jgi:LmbE family N-acetylglucosaminyl deacetylase
VFTLRLGDVPRSRLRVLALGAHADDIEIGCGGTMLRLAQMYPQLEAHWVVLSGSSDRAGEARASAESFLGGVAEPQIVVKQFRDGYFPHEGGAVKDFFEELKAQVAPDLILTHQRYDLHQDHRVVCELTWNTFRDHLILEYEIPKYDGDLGAPNFFVHLDQETCDRKIRSIMAHFATQLDRRWFTDDLFRSLLRLRGMESNAPDGTAEAFYCRKIAV